jgi:hypothetical protein
MGKIMQGLDGSKNGSSPKVASINKLRGHKLEKIYADRVNGSVVKGVGKVDVLEVTGKNTSCKGAKKHIQILLQSKDSTIDRFKTEHPITEFVIAGHKVKKFKVENKNKINVDDKNIWKSKADELSNWLTKKENFKEILNYIFSNNSIHYLVVLEDEKQNAFKFKIKDIIDFYVKLDYQVYTTAGCKVVVKSIIPNVSSKPLVIFNLEIRGSVGKIGSINYWNDAQRFYKTIKENLKHEIIKP